MFQMFCIEISGSASLYGDEEDMIGAAFGDSFVQWKSIDLIDSRHCNYMLEIIDKISLECKNFVGLSVEEVHINEIVASAFASKLATIKCLVLDKAIIDEADLETILMRIVKTYLILLLELRTSTVKVQDPIDNRCYVEESEYYIDYEEKEFPPFPDCILYGDYYAD